MSKRPIVKAFQSLGCSFGIATNTNLSDLDKNNVKRIAIDISQLMHRLGPYNLCGGIIDLIKTFSKLGCSLIFVFDGKPPKEKKSILDNRKVKRDKHKKLVKKYEEHLKNFEKDLSSITSKEKKAEIKKQMSEITVNIKKHKKRTFSIKKEHITLLKNLFDFLNISYIHLKIYEADAVCSTLVKMNIADACLSDDYDLISYNCRCILRNLNITKGTVDIINLDKIYSLIKLNYEEFIYLIIMNGTDYSRKVRDINLTYIYSLLLQKFDISDILLLINNPTYNYQTAYKIFTQQIDVNPHRDIVNYEVGKHIYRNINTDKSLFVNQLNKYNSNTTDQIDIKNTIKKMNEYISLYSYVNPYLCLSK
tara:strand:- start:126 stop:1217 length:1092 start_codon:yes stop_codon:yes gene_type:complete